MTIQGPTHSDPIATRQSSREEERHTRAVAQTLSWAQEAAACDAFDDALEWLRTVEVVDGALSPRWQRTQASWHLLLAQRREALA